MKNTHSFICNLFRWLCKRWKSSSQIYSGIDYFSQEEQPIVVNKRQLLRRTRWVDTPTLSFIFLLLLTHWFSVLQSWYCFHTLFSFLNLANKIEIIASGLYPWCFTYIVVKNNDVGSVKVSPCRKTERRWRWSLYGGEE